MWRSLPKAKPMPHLVKVQAAPVVVWKHAGVVGEKEVPESDFHLPSPRKESSEDASAWSMRAWKQLLYFLGFFTLVNHEVLQKEHSLTKLHRVLCVGRQRIRHQADRKR